MSSIVEVPVPPESCLPTFFRRIYFVDAWQAPLSLTELSAEGATRAIFGRSPGWVRALMALRGVFATATGLKHSGVRTSEARPGLFRVQRQERNEIILGEDDRHLNFRISVLRSDTPNGATVTVSTAVEVHNRLGRAYMAAVKPFHRVIVRSMLREAVRAGRL